VLSAGGEEGVR